MKRGAALIAMTLLVLGLSVGFIPFKASGTDCGSAFHQSGAAFVADLANSFSNVSTDITAQCGDLRSVVRVPALALLLTSLAMSVVALVAASVEGRATERKEQAAVRPG